MTNMRYAVGHWLRPPNNLNPFYAVYEKGRKSTTYKTTSKWPPPALRSLCGKLHPFCCAPSEINIKEGKTQGSSTLSDLNSIDIIHLHNCFQIPPAALWYRSDNENFLGRVTKSSFWKLDNQRGLWAEERLFWGIPLNQLFKSLEGRSHILFVQEQETKPIHTKH